MLRQGERPGHHQLVTVINRADRELSYTYGGRPYKLKLGEQQVPLAHVRFAKSQNPVMGTENLETGKYISLVAIKDSGDDCSPIAYADAVRRRERLDRSRLVEPAAVKAVVENVDTLVERRTLGPTALDSRVHAGCEVDAGFGTSLSRKAATRAARLKWSGTEPKPAPPVPGLLTKGEDVPVRLADTVVGHLSHNALLRVMRHDLGLGCRADNLTRTIANEAQRSVERALRTLADLLPYLPEKSPAELTDTEFLDFTSRLSPRERNHWLSVLVVQERALRLMWSAPAALRKRAQTVLKFSLPARPGAPTKKDERRAFTMRKVVEATIVRFEDDYACVRAMFREGRDAVEVRHWLEGRWSDDSDAVEALLEARTKALRGVAEEYVWRVEGYAHLTSLRTVLSKAKSKQKVRILSR